MGERVIVDKAFRERINACGLRHYGDFLSMADRSEQIASSRSGRTFRVRLGDGAQSIDAYLKIHDYAYWRRARWRREKGELETANYATMRNRCGVDVPAVIAHGSRTRGWRYRDGFILTQSIRGAASLDRFVEADPGRVDNRLLGAVAGVVRRMHSASYFHIDLQWRNILVVDSAEGGDRPGAADAPLSPLHVYLLDSPRGGIQSSGVGRQHGRIRDLSSLYKDARRWLSPRVQLRWLKCYLGTRRLTAIDRGMIRTILRDRAIKDRTHAA
ncbi:MAG: hypothetical protein H6818_20885 [Phycisphaerales bacterium]|nr:hypothetical protein [Phycisphaerales bacterium]MCB9862247.1 hypothetical protein [Phycisphaerales bacterium]